MCLQSAAFYVKFNIKASLEAVLVAVDDVLPVGPALHAHLHVIGQVGELHSHQRLQVLWLQQLPVVGVVLQPEAGIGAHPIVLHRADLVCVLVSLQGGRGGTTNDNHPNSALAALGCRSS